MIFSNLFLLEWLSSKGEMRITIIGKEMEGKETLNTIGGNAN